METLSMLSVTRNINPVIKFALLNPKSKAVSRNNGITTISALRRSNSNGSQYHGRQVDENMIVLRKRIHEMKRIERNYEAPSEWMQWEKQMYVNYDEYICMVLGFLQIQLMNTRPSVALATLAVFTFSVPVSVILLVSHFAGAADNIF